MEYDAIAKLLESKRDGIADVYTESINDSEVLKVVWQSGGTATNEKNGVFIEDLIIVAVSKLKEFNDYMPSRENSLAITKLEEAILWLSYRKRERELRGVYGTEEK